jgi:hypothetical protein
MKKLFLIMVLLLFCICHVQGQNIKQKSIKPKYENVFYKKPNSKKKIFIVERIVYGANYRGKDSKHIYQVSVYGKVEGKSEQIHYNASSTDEFDYFRRAFKSNYKEILLFENSYKIGSKTYNNTSIAVEY